MRRSGRPEVLLNDEQIREFIVNGFVVVQPDVEPSLHASIDTRIAEVSEHETWHGNNIVSRVPELHQIVRSPRVDGALQSIVGNDYLVHPHRALHVSTPVADPDLDYTDDFNAPPMGDGSNAGSGWHQDAHSPLARARHHFPRFVIGFYFPQETPRAMGPTRLQAGSQLYSQPVEPAAVVLPDILAAGSFVIAHFDMVHAAFPNRAARRRFMVKFVFVRTRPPAAPTWLHTEPEWRLPHAALVGYDVEPAWRAIWDWMRGNPGNRDLESTDVGSLNATDQAGRLRAIYSFAPRVDAITQLCDALTSTAGKGRHKRALASDHNGETIPRDDTTGFPRRWNERAIVMEDEAYALAALGEPVLEPVVALAGHDDPWVQINAAFVLGELGPVARRALPALARLLASPESTVVRQALDAVGTIVVGIDITLDQIERLLGTENPNWQRAQVTRGWVDADQVRLNAAFALTSVAIAGEFDEPTAARIERILIGALADSNGYVGAVAVEGLKRLGTPDALDAAFEYLEDRRWDETLNIRKPF